VIGTIRFVLACMVLVSHTRGYPFGKLPDPGLSAIVAFFFLSGFLMPATLETNYSDSFFRQSARYYLNRFLRIFPIYWAALIAVWGVLFFFPSTAAPYYLNSATSFIQNWLLLGLNQSMIWHHDQRFIGPAWTLDVELQYYLIAPFAILLARKVPVLAGILLCAGSVMGLYYLRRPTGLDDIDRSLLTWGVFFAAGFLSYWKLGWIRTHIGSKRIFYASMLTFVAAFAAAFFSAAWSHWLLACALMLLILFALVADIKSSKTDVFLGDLSYPVFILHAVVTTTGIPAAIAASIAPGSVPIHTVVIFLCTMPIAVLAHFAIAKPLDRLRRKLKTRPEPDLHATM
jgi:peptidoglycan/LPS O-acetylase OafA/YrhL